MLYLGIAIANSGYPWLSQNSHALAGIPYSDTFSLLIIACYSKQYAGQRPYSVVA